ncbi:MAG: hypothetical protein ABI576_13030 [Flavobacterium sp.]
MKNIIFTLFLFSIKMGFSQNTETQIINELGYSKIALIIKKDTINFLIHKTDGITAKPTLLFIQGSLPIPIVFHDELNTRTLLPFKVEDFQDQFNFVIIARKGIPLIGTYGKDEGGYKNETGDVPLEYEKNNNLKYRVWQAQEVLNYLYKQKWVEKRKIFVVGHSEGYRVAAKLSEYNKKIAKLVCMSADPFNRITEGILRERVTSFSQNNDSISQSYIENDINNFKKIPTDIEQYKHDFSIYNWYSYNKELCFKSFSKFKNPILIVYGTNDIPATHNDLLPFLLPKSDITLKIYPDFDHNYFKKEFDKTGKSLEDSYNWDTVFKDVTNWLLLKK